VSSRAAGRPDRAGDSPRFQAAGFTDLGGGKPFKLTRDAYSAALNASEDWFTTTMLISGLSHPNWPEGAGAFIAFDLERQNIPQIQVGASVNGGSTAADVIWAYCDSVRTGDPQYPALRDRPEGTFPSSSARVDGGEWVYDDLAWQPGDPDGDVTWILDRLLEAKEIWDACRASRAQQL
jgi:hypothetical protein